MGLDALFEPLQVGPLTLENRIVLTAHHPRLGGKRYYRYLAERFEAGIGLAICSRHAAPMISAVTPGPPGTYYNGDADDVPPDPTTPAGIRFFDETVLPDLRAEADLAHRHGVACMAQLLHSGSYATGANLQMSVSPSGIPDELLGENSHELDSFDIERIKRAFVLGAERAHRAGMDGVEVHAAHGLLLNAFLSPATNRRTDEYGGTWEGRSRILLEILTEIRQVTGPGFVVGVRMPGSEGGDDGMRPADGDAIAKAVSGHVDYVSVSGATEGGRQRGILIPAVMAGTEHCRSPFAADAARINGVIGPPVLLTGRITDPVYAAELIEQGVADMVGVVRGMIADPAWARKARSGDLADLRRCVGDNEGCRARTLFRARGGGLSVGCTVNASVGHEEDMAITRTDSPRRVAVIGAGPAGLEAARVATLRGHHVTVFERESQVGGQVLTASLDPRATELRLAVDYLAEQMHRLGIDMRLRTEVSVETLRREPPDAVIVATGASPRQPDPATLEGSDAGQVVTAASVLRGESTVGDRVLVVAGYDGHRAPLSLSEMLRNQGRDVHLITERALAGESQDPATNHAMVARLLQLGVEITTFTAFEGLCRRKAEIRHCLSRLPGVIEDIDTVITVQRQANSELLQRLRAEFTDILVQPIGDCLAPRRILHAVQEGARAAHALG